MTDPTQKVDSRVFIKLPKEVIDFFVEVEKATAKLTVWDSKSAHVVRGHRETKEFTPDGRMVGDIGEALAEKLFPLRLEKNLRAGYDAVLETDDSIRVEIKMTRNNIFQFRKIPNRVIALSVTGIGDVVEIVYNGLGALLVEKVSQLKLAQWVEDHWTLAKATNVPPACLRGLVPAGCAGIIPFRPGCELVSERGEPLVNLLPEDKR